MFRRRRGEKLLSADELKTKLFSHWDKTGTLNRMRAELREKLYSELLKNACPVETADISSSDYTFDRTVLPFQISNWLVYDHLLRQGYQYALSIFVTEANFPTHPEKLLGACDILVLLGLDSTSSEYKNVIQTCSTSSSEFTHSLLVAVIKCLFDLTTREGRFSQMKEQTESQIETEDRVSRHEKSLDPESHELKESCELKESYELKESTKFLKPRKGSADSSLHDQELLLKEEKEKVQQLRHRLLHELDRLYAQEHKQQLEMKQLRNELQEERDGIFREKEKIRQKELLVDKEFENKLEKKIRELEMEFISKMHIKEKDSEVLLQKLHEKEQKLNLLEMNLSNQRESYISSKRESEDIKQLYTTLQIKYSSLLDENTILLKKFESLSDYAVLKADLETKSKELNSVHQEFEEYRRQVEKERDTLFDNLRKLEMQLKIKETELLEAQRQLNRIRDTLHMEEAMWHKERKKLEQEVISSREMYQTLIQRIEEQKEDIQALHRTIHILHYQITDKSARNTARVEPFMSNRSTFKIPDVPKREPDVFRINSATEDSPSKYSQKSLQFIGNAQDRISKIQQETDALQYQISGLHSSVPNLSSRIISNPLLFNLTTEHRFQPPNFHSINPTAFEFPSSHFKNLIHNELPTLDLSFSNRNKSQLASAHTNITKSGLSIDAPTVTAEKNMSSDSNKSLKHSENVNEKSNFPLYTHTSASTSNQKTNDGRCRAGKETEESAQSNLNHSNTTPESLFKESSLGNTRISKTMPAFVEGNGISNSPDISTIKTRGEDGNKQSEKYVERSRSLFRDALHEASTTVHAKNLTQNLNDSKADRSAELEGNKIVSETVSRVETDVKNSTSVLSHVSSYFPVVDLDAAWKRKSSMQSSSLTPINRQTPIEIQSMEIDVSQTKSREFQTVAQDLPVGSSDKTNLSENSKEASSSQRLGQQNQSMEPQSISHQSNSETSQPQGTAPQLEKDKVSFSEKAETVSAGVLKPVDSGDEQDVITDQKPVHEDSLSELSEIHLSCGSEQEQQKEDSDNW